MPVVTRREVDLATNYAQYTAPPQKAGFLDFDLLDEMVERQCQVKYHKDFDTFEVHSFIESRPLGQRWLAPVYLFSPKTKLTDLAH